jgi:CheY-like chemotaxis protein
VRFAASETASAQQSASRTASFASASNTYNAEEFAGRDLSGLSVVGSCSVTGSAKGHSSSGQSQALEGHDTSDSTLRSAGTFTFVGSHTTSQEVSNRILQQPSRKAAITSGIPARSWSRNDRVLVVDDAKPNRVMLSRRLRKKGLSVKSAEDGQFAFEKFCAALDEDGHYRCHSNKASSEPGTRVDTASFHAIVTDMTMPRMMGDELAEKVVAESTLRDVPCPVIIGVTGNALPDDIQRFKDRGAHEVLLKPVSSDAVLSVVHRLLEKHLPTSQHSSPALASALQPGQEPLPVDLHHFSTALSGEADKKESD